MPRSSTVLTLGSASLEALVVSCEHASRSLPVSARPSRVERSILSSHWGWDIGAWDLAGRLVRTIGGTAVGGRHSRLWIDLNRALGDPELIRPEVEGAGLSWNTPITPVELDRRIGSHHAPYHQELDRVIGRRLVRGIRPLLLAIHSFTPELGAHRREFDAGVLYVGSRREARILARGLKRAGLVVRYNEPYSGLEGLMYSIHRHGSHHGLPCLELEVNQGILKRPRSARACAEAVIRAVRDLTG